MANLQGMPYRALQGFSKSIQGFSGSPSCFTLVNGFGENANFSGSNPSSAYSGTFASSGVYDDIVYAVYSDVVYGISAIDGSLYATIDFDNDFPTDTLRSVCVDSGGVYVFHDSESSGVYTLKATKYPLSGGAYLSTNNYLTTDSTQAEWISGEESPFIRKSVVYDSDIYLLLPANHIVKFNASSLSIDSVITLPANTTWGSGIPAYNMCRFDIYDDKIYTTWRTGSGPTTYQTKLTVTNMSGSLDSQGLLIDRSFGVSGYERGHEITIHDGHIVMSGNGPLNKRSLTTKEIVCTSLLSELTIYQPDLNPAAFGLFSGDFHAARSDGAFLYSSLAFSQTASVYGVFIGKVLS